MLSGSESISTYTRPNVAIWMVLAFQGGLLNTGGLLACHSFVSHVTGFFTLFGTEADRGDWVLAGQMLLVPGFFMLGAMISGFLIAIQIKLRRKPRYYIVFGAIFIELLFVVVGGYNHLFGEFGEPLRHLNDYSLLALLCMICGMQNGLITMVSKSVVRTTHLSGIVTDLGVGLAHVFNRGHLTDEDDEGRANLMRIGIIVCFTLGSVAGVRLFSSYAFRGFLFPMLISGVLFALTVYFQLLRRTGAQR